MKWLVLSMSVISTFARLSVRAAAMPPNPPPMITTRGGTGTSGKPLFEGSGSERHEKHQQYQKNTVRSRCSKSQRTELSEDLHRDRPVGMGVVYHARHAFTDGGHRREQSPRDETRSRGRQNHSSHRQKPAGAKPPSSVFERSVHLSQGPLNR